MPTEAEVAWLAALIDGEGSVGMTRQTYHHKRQNDTGTKVGLRVSVIVVNTNRELLERCVEIAGGTVNPKDGHPKKLIGE